MASLNYLARVLVALPCASYALRFATTHGVGMVLPSAPQQATVWGFCDENESSVEVCVDNVACVDAKLSAGANGTTFLAVLPAVDASLDSHRITAKSPEGTTTGLEGVLFGTVWVCSGQSNMDLTVPLTFNGSDAVQEANEYPFIRVFTIARTASNVPLDEPAVNQPWAPASNVTIGGPWPVNNSLFPGWENKAGNAPDGAGVGFSAVCWFYGRELFKHTGLPVGLIWASVGGTVVQKWSSASALDECGGQHTDNGVHYNAMISPLLRSAISGAVWYQGESNFGNPLNYNCSFPAMIRGWRTAWSNATLGTTPSALPFGFVQLSTKSDSTNQTVGGYGTGLWEKGYAAIRWAQTASMGVTPNPAMPAVFMAVSVDIGQARSPAKGPHVQNKEDVGRRLALGYRALLGEETLAPGPSAVRAAWQNDGVELSFSLLPAEGFQALPTQIGFELSAGDDVWVNASKLTLTAKGQKVFVSPPTGFAPRQIRYLWSFTPCLPEPGLECPLRKAHEHALPAVPFVLNITDTTGVTMV